MKGKHIREYLINTLNGMALGLFSSLIIGLILKQLGELTGIQQLVWLGQVAQFMMGPAIGAAVAYNVKASPLAIFATVAAGAIGAGTVQMADAGMTIAIGEPMGAFVAAPAASEFSKRIAGRTRVDIVLVPAATIIVGGLVGIFLSPAIAAFMKGIGAVINTATELRPVPMGIIVAVLMGMILTLPISSAALAISLGLSGVAAGASLIGCSAQMVGFAVISYRENGFGGLLAQGLGTSMLQVPNIIRNPRIWIPPIVASAILGPIGSAVLKMESNSIGAGMGTSGLVGQFGTIAAMGETVPMARLISLMGLMHFLLPALISWAVARYLRRKGWIKVDDLRLTS